MMDIEVSDDGADGVTRLTIRGPLDDQAGIESAFRDLTGPVEVDLSGLGPIVSEGIRLWVLAVSGVAEGCRLEFHRVPVAMIEQFNLIENARGRGRVLTFEAPYFCVACDAERDILLEVGSEEFGGPGPPRPPARACPECEADLQFDDLPERYFTFLESSP